MVRKEIPTEAFSSLGEERKSEFFSRKGIYYFPVKEDSSDFSEPPKSRGKYREGSKIIPKTKVSTSAFDVSAYILIKTGNI